MTGTEHTTATHLEIEAISRTAVDRAMQAQEERLPGLMRPIMYEVAEKVSAKAHEIMVGTLSSIFSLDVTDEQQLGVIKRDMFWVRDQRLQEEQQALATKQAVRLGLLKVVGIVCVSAIFTILTALGIQIVHL